MNTIKCERCKIELLVAQVRYLELSQTDGHYYDTIPQGHISQGSFPFGTACATAQLKETTAYLRRKIPTSVTPHTPTPWEFEEKEGATSFEILSTGEWPARIGKVYDFRTAASKANARLIVTAVNNHHKLLEALRMCSETLRRYSDKVKNGVDAHELGLTATAVDIAIKNASDEN